MLFDFFFPEFLRSVFSVGRIREQIIIEMKRLLLLKGRMKWLRVVLCALAFFFSVGLSATNAHKGSVDANLPSATLAFLQYIATIFHSYNARKYS